MIKAIIFDMGGVLLPAVEKRYEEIGKEIGFPLNFKSEENLPDFVATVKGKITTAEFCKILEKRFNLKVDLLSILTDMEKSARAHLNYELLDFAKKLRGKYSVALITDATDLNSRLNREIGLYDYFDPCIVSCEVGYKKPEKEIFELVIERLKMTPKECIFIDDREQNLKTPKEMGFNVILFKNNGQFLKDLKTLGISIS